MMLALSSLHSAIKGFDCRTATGLGSAFIPVDAGQQAADGLVRCNRNLVRPALLCAGAPLRNLSILGLHAGLPDTTQFKFRLRNLLGMNPD
jgi:hypothetical protein